MVKQGKTFSLIVVFVDWTLDISFQIDSTCRTCSFLYLSIQLISNMEIIVVHVQAELLVLTCPCQIRLSPGLCLRAMYVAGDWSWG